jgi:glycosyltransferase involved in cell wall biosynthesis
MVESAAQPFVSVVTPVYNTDRYLAECIESVLAQGHSNFEYIINDNWSTDRSRAIAESYLAKDSRIRLVSPERFLDQIANYNFTMRQVSPRAQYVKIVQADDWITPSCLSDMVAIAQQHPSIGLVSSYRLEGHSVLGTGLEPSQRFLAGKEAGRLHLLHPEVFLFGSQTTVMYRADLVRARQDFFEDGMYHCDTIAAYDCLRRSDLGFVHQVLSYSRLDPESVTGQRTDLCWRELDYLVALKRYGQDFLTPDEYSDRLERATRAYYRALARKWLLRPTLERRAKFWEYQKQGLDRIGEKLQRARFVASFVRQIGVELLPSVIREAGRPSINS